MVDMTHLFRRACQSALTILWPPTCVLCGCRGDVPCRDLCADCEADLPRNDFACQRCAEPLVCMADESPLLCGACLKRSPHFDAATCAFHYAYPLDRLVRALKCQGALAHARVLGDLLANRLQTHTAALPQLLLPVPLAQQRFASRGYNQALEIGRYLEQRLGVKMRTDLIVRTRDTAEQAGLGRNERRRNIRGAFALIGKLPGRHIAIVDDVITTGSTANELAKVLKRAGAKRVEVWAAARAGKYRK